MQFRKRIWMPALLAAGIIFGPRPDYPSFDSVLPDIPMSLEALDSFVQEKDRDVPLLKPGNESRILWADGLRKTPFSVVYLHGWSASPEEGDPLHREFARRYGCNLYLPRLAGHGLADDRSFETLTPGELMASAKEALAIGELIGEKVILMSCSTGGTLSIYLAAKNPDAVDALLLYSPNIDIYDPMSELLTGPWGRQLTRMIVGEHHSFTPPEEGYRYWTTTYSSEGLICLKSLIESTMKPEIWRSIDQPLFMGYYYRNEEEQDMVVSVEEMHRFFEGVSTPSSMKRSVAFPEAGHHVVLSRIQAKDLSDVKRETCSFAEEVLGMKAAE